jgi:hypothetical protein
MGIYSEALQRGLENENKHRMCLENIRKHLKEASDEVTKELGYCCRFKLEKSKYQHIYQIRAYRAGFADENDFEGPYQFLGEIEIDAGGSYFCEYKVGLKKDPKDFDVWLVSKLSNPNVADSLVRLGEGKI